MGDLIVALLGRVEQLGDLGDRGRTGMHVAHLRCGGAVAGPGHDQLQSEPRRLCAPRRPVDQLPVGIIQEEHR
jgi:hypothetical protein